MLAALGPVTLIQEHVTFLLDGDAVFAQSDRERELAVAVAGHLATVVVLDDDVVNQEPAALDGIEGILVINYALHGELALVGEVLRCDAA